MNPFSDVEALISESETSGLVMENVGLSGFSGTSLLGTLQRLGRRQAVHGDYLEVGVFQGLSLLSTASCTPARVFGIDNFSQLDSGSKNRSIIEDRIAMNGLQNVCLIDADFEEAFEGLGALLGKRQVSLYFVDGPHDYRSQLYCLEIVRPFLSPGAVIVVDDSNYRHVRQANHDFLVFNPEYALLFEAYTESHPDNMAPDKREMARRGWWNGVNIIVHDHDNALERVYPPVPNSRKMFENEHFIQSARLGMIAPELTMLVSAMSACNLRKTARQFAKLLVNARRVPEGMRGDYVAVNTWSKNLPRSRFNPTLGIR